MHLSRQGKAGFVVAVEGSTLMIKVGEIMDLSLHEEFRRAYESRREVITNYVVDLGDTLHIDSSALGMLLILREYAGGDRNSISLINVRPALRRLLAIVNFDVLFEVSLAEA